MTPSVSVGTWLGADPSVLDDETLLTGARELGELRRLVEASLGSFAAEVKHRSRREDGFGGLAQRLGAATPEKLVEQVAGVSKRESHTLTRVGQLLTPDADPWLTAVGTGVASGAVSVVKADVIKNGGCQIVCVRGVGFLRKDDTDDHDRQGSSSGASTTTGGRRPAAA